MYSPKIKEELIPRIHQLAKSRGIAMTDLVNQVLEKALGNDSKSGRREEGQSTENEKIRK